MIMKSFKNRIFLKLLIVMISFGWFLMSAEFVLADKCTDKYPSGKGDGACVEETKCLSPKITDKGLCVGLADNIKCCHSVVVTPKTGFCVCKDNSCKKYEYVTAADIKKISEEKCKTDPCYSQFNLLESCPSGGTSKEVNQLQLEAKSLNPVGMPVGAAGILKLVGKFINFLIFPIGMFTMALYIWAGFLWMTAAGNAENVKKAQTIIVWTTLGVLATLGSYMIVNFLFDIIA